MGRTYDVAAIVAAYQAGETCESIALRIKASPMTISGILVGAGIPRRDSKPMPVQIKEARLRIRQLEAIVAKLAEYVDDERGEGFAARLADKVIRDVK